MEIYSVPVFDKLLLYAPLHHLSALVDWRAAQSICMALQIGAPAPEVLRSILKQLSSPGDAAPAVRTGRLSTPLFLGLIPTRGCNLGCRYCDFAAPKQTSPLMALSLARQAIDGYLSLLKANGGSHAELHFFGGEPFYAEKVVHFAVEYAALRSAESGLSMRFVATTNGLFSAGRCRWIAERFDTIVLSLDGPQDVQERQRPAINGRPTFPIIYRNAKILSDGPVELVMRVCVTGETVGRMAEIAAWLASEFRPSSVCFESLVESPLARQAGLRAPDPWEFAANFNGAADVLDSYGIETVLSTADMKSYRTSFCPVGKDALIVSPDGAIAGCYLLEQDWVEQGLDMRLGRVTPQGLEIVPHSVQRLRDLGLPSKSLCQDCLCRFHCAGGCHVNHDTARPSGEYDPLCVQTRLVTVLNLLKQMGQEALAIQFLADRPAMEAAVFQPSDRLLEIEFKP